MPGSAEIEGAVLFNRRLASRDIKQAVERIVNQSFSPPGIFPGTPGSLNKALMVWSNEKVIIK
jgi:hypothetical protein